MLTDDVQTRLKFLQELLAEKAKREAAARAEAYNATIAERGSIPMIILDPHDGDIDGQRKQRLAELDGPAHWIEIEIITPEPQVALPGEQWEPVDAINVTPTRALPPLLSANGQRDDFDYDIPYPNDRGPLP